MLRLEKVPTQQNKSIMLCLALLHHACLHVGMATDISAAADVTTDQTDPEIL